MNADLNHKQCSADFERIFEVKPICLNMEWQGFSYLPDNPNLREIDTKSLN